MRKSRKPKMVSSSRNTWCVNSGSNGSAVAMSAAVRTSRNDTASFASHTNGSASSSAAAGAGGACLVGSGLGAFGAGTGTADGKLGGGPPPIFASSLRRLASCASIVVMRLDAADSACSGGRG